MGFLAPLYIAAAAAVSLPVIFHLIRRMPRGRFPFGSLMFLAPSPPRLARRNRLENKLLLLLRALALTLLAVAFARPFFREPAAGAAGEMIARRIAILLDTSASMRRAGLWPEAKRRVEAVLDGIAAGDDVALYTFDSGVRIRAGFSDIIPRDPRPRQAEIRALVAGIEPTWAGTDLGAALVTVADALQDLGAAGPGEAGAVRAIVLVSDLAEGSRIDALDGFDWPPDVGTEIAAVSGADPNNAGLALAAPAAGVAEPDAGPAGVRAIIANDRESRSTEFTLRWKAAGDAGAD
ncbi:MAG: BatA domain-containing protein, partial [Planctomycetes bacterium]|nr:BatA domain-containing protein [Planctomycetota bacterium]